MTDAGLPHSGANLSISCVVYDTDFDILAATINSLFKALQAAQSLGQIIDYRFFLINNQTQISNHTKNAFALAQQLMGPKAELLSGHGNIGYGRGNNLAINRSTSDYHLILNPDVEMDEQALAKGLQFFAQTPDAGMLAPDAINENNEPEYLAKLTPSLLIIFLRGLNNKFLNNIFKTQLDNYTYKDKFPFSTPMEIELASGCFMFCRTRTLKQVSGFSKEYFLYFEDFDLSRKISGVGKIYLVPQIRITHLGGKAASKGLKHIKMFLHSYFIFRANIR
jgi:GT2 family glycosyltransferase